MAQIKYIKSRKPAAEHDSDAMPPNRAAAAAKASAPDSADKPKANTKAKLTHPEPRRKAAAAKAPATGAAAAAKSSAAAAKKSSAAAKTSNGAAAKKSSGAAAKKSSGAAVKKSSGAAAKTSRAQKTAAADAAEVDGVAAAKKTASKPKTTKKTAAANKPDSATSAAAAPKASRKRKADGEAAAAPAKKAKLLAKGPVLREPPTQVLNVYVFGEGTAGELGLGTAKNCVDVKRPRLNPYLGAKHVGVVQIEAGGMHAIALTKDNKILTWGVNDQGTLGRDTTWDGGLKDMDGNTSDSDSESGDDNGLNPKESTPGEVDWSQTELAEGTRFVEVAAGDSTSFVLTDDGKVYGWGTFRSNDGVFGFTPDHKVATRPVLIPGIKNITTIKAGANHAMAMDTKRAVYAWGSGQQNQLGRRIVERTKAEGLTPREFGLPKGAKKHTVSIATGAYHSFAILNNGEVYAWGLNNFGETGIMDNAGQDDAVIMNPTEVKALKGLNIISLKGGGHHSVAAIGNGDCLVWGRIDGYQTGIAQTDIDNLPHTAVIKDEHGRPRILAQPHKVTAINGAVQCVASASDHNIVITKEGKAWSWGFSANYQTGQGTDDDVPVATVIDNTAVREKKLNGATAGGQFSIITAPADDVPVTNGV